MSSNIVINKREQGELLVCDSRRDYLVIRLVNYYIGSIEYYRRVWSVPFAQQYFPFDT